MAVLTSEQEPCCRKPTDPPAISLYPKPKVYQGRGQYFELLRSACHCVESAHKRCQEQGCILNPPFAKKQKGSFTIHTLRQEPVLQKAEVLHTQGTKQPAFSMQRSRTWCSPVKQVGDFLPAIPTDPSQLRSCSSSALNLQTILHEVEKSSQLLQQKWACLAEQTLVKKQSRNGGQRGFSCLQRQSPGRRGHWCQLWEQLVQNTSSLLHQRPWGQAKNPGCSYLISNPLQKKEAAKTCPVPRTCIYWVSRVSQGVSAEEHPVSAFELHTELATACKTKTFPVMVSRRER